MAVQLPSGEDTEMNMTPMIDIVFQLIIFFMLQLKFKEIDRQIDSNLPKDAGPAATPAENKEFQKVKVKVFRRNLQQDASQHYTYIKIDNSHEFGLPMGWKSIVDNAPEDVAKYTATMDQIQAVIRSKFHAFPDRSTVKGEITAPPPSGGFVPHGDVMRILDMFITLQFPEVIFEGAQNPLPEAEVKARLGG